MQKINDIANTRIRKCNVISNYAKAHVYVCLDTIQNDIYKRKYITLQQVFIYGYSERGLEIKVDAVSK